MHIYLEKIINFFLYSNLYIAFCALAMTLQTLYLLNLNYKTSSSLLGLVFFATWLIYALHRLVSLRKVDPALHLQRFTIIRNYQTHIFLYTLFSAFGVGYFLWQLDWMHLKYLVFPGILSFAYILPFLKTKQEKNV